MDGVPKEMPSGGKPPELRAPTSRRGEEEREPHYGGRAVNRILRILTGERPEREAAAHAVTAEAVRAGRRNGVRSVDASRVAILRQVLDTSIREKGMNIVNVIRLRGGLLMERLRRLRESRITHACMSALDVLSRGRPPKLRPAQA